MESLREGFTDLEFIQDFKRLILKRADDLKRYANSASPKVNYINNENVFISELVRIYDSVTLIDFLDTWVTIERKIAHLQKQDPSVSGFTIVLRTKPNSNNLALIEHDCF